MSSLYSQFKTDENLEREGILLEYGMTDPIIENGKEVSKGKPICIRIARAGGSNKAYERLLDAEVKPYKRMIQNETVDPEISNRILRRVFARTVVIGWENVQDADKKDIPFSVEACEKLFQELPDLFLDVQAASQRAALFKADIRRLDSKN